MERADASFNDTRARAEAQFVSTNDVTRARIERAAATQSVANAQGSLQQARVNLEYLLNAAIAGDLIPPDRVLATLTLPVPQLIKQALTQRPDLGASREGVAAANSQADEPGLRFVPTLNAAGQGRISDQAIAGDRYLDATVALNLAWNIWDAGVRSADADSRRAAAQTLDWQMRLLRRRVSADVQAAVATVTATRTALQASGEAVEAARQSAEETSILYKQGLAKAIELVNANLSRFDAEVSLAAAQLALRQAELDLRAALGLFPIDGVK